MFSPLGSIKLKKLGLEMESWDAALKSYLIEGLPEINTKEG